VAVPDKVLTDTKALRPYLEVSLRYVKSLKPKPRRRNSLGRFLFEGLMDPNTSAAIAEGGIADITTTGRKTGSPRRIEIYFHSFEGVHYITGRPGSKRDWLANLKANPDFTLHLKRGVTADLPAVATEITDRQRRWDLLLRARTESWGVEPERAERDHEFWVEKSPLVSFVLG